MAQIKISEMPTASTVNLTDYVPIVQEGINKKTSVQNFVGNEAERIEAEKKRVEAEEARVAAEKSRVQFEEQRKRDENTRVSNENERTLKEEERISNENSRQSNEEDRVSSESTRVSSENTRIENENARIEAEDARIEYDLSRKNADIGGFLEQEGTAYSGPASDYGVELYKMVGKTVQETTNGYQLFDVSKISNKTQGGATVTNNNDGSLTISGSGNLTENFSINYYYSKEDTLSLLKAGTLKANGLGNASPNVLFGLRNKNTGSYITGKSVSKTVNSCQIEQSDLDSLGDDIVLSISMYTAQGTQITGGTIKPMIYIDGDGTWEQFTGGKPAPNPDYPMDIENVEISKINSFGGYQLFDASKLPTKTQGGATLTNNGDGSFTISGSGTLTTPFDTSYEIEDISFLKTGNLTLSGVSPTKPVLQIIGYNTDAINDRTFVLTHNNPTVNISADRLEKTKGIYCIFYGNERDSIKAGTITPMLYQDGDGTWEPFKHATVETSIILADGEVYEEGQPILRKRKKVMFDGSSDEDWQLLGVHAGTDVKTIPFYISVSNLKRFGKGLCNRFKNRLGGLYNTDIEGFNQEEGAIRIRINRDSLAEQTAEGFKKWLQSNPIEVEYELETPATETIKVPTIPSYYPNTNIWTDSIVEPTKTVWRANTTSGLAIENKERLDQVQYDGLYVKGETYSGIASNKGIKLHKVVGKTEQGTTKGYQLLDASKIATKSQGGATVTNNNDGSFTVTGSGNLVTEYEIRITLDTETSKRLVKEGTINLSAPSTTPYVFVGFKNSDGIIGELNVRDKTLSTMTLTSEQINSDGFCIQLGFWGSKDKPIKTGTVKPMLYQDGDGTWEQYTGGKPAPNPDYPMEIENVEIKKIVSSSKNIIADIPDTLSRNDCTYLYNEANKMLTIKATGSNAQVGEVSYPGRSYNATNGVLYLIPKNAIKVYFKSDTGAFNSVYATFYNKDKVSLGFAVGGSYTIPEGAKYVSFRIGITESVIGISYSDRVYASFEEIGEYIEGKYNEVETSLTLAEGDVYEEGQPILRKRKKVVFDGSSDEAWVMDYPQGSFKRFYVPLDSMIRVKDYTNIMKCNRFSIIKGNNTIELGATGYATIGNYPNKNWFYINGMNEFETVNDLKTWLSTHNVEVEYELATPYEEELKVPTIPSYNPQTNIWTDNTLSTDIEWELLANSDKSLDIEALEKRIAALEKQMIGG